MVNASRGSALIVMDTMRRVHGRVELTRIIVIICHPQGMGRAWKSAQLDMMIMTRMVYVL
jgi:hypothetical protein